MPTLEPHREPREGRKKEKRDATPYLPTRITLPSMRAAVQGCRGCDLYKNATQAVFGEGAAKAACVFVGEQPGNEEDKEGKPFVGPAGRILDKGLADAGIARELVYITNAVKHFKHEMRGARRLHRSPNVGELNACRPWLEQELKVTKPKVIVCMGTTAARSVLGRKITLRDVRGQVIDSLYADKTVVTTHPSSILRSPDDESRRRNYEAFVADLKIVAGVLE